MTRHSSPTGGEQFYGCMVPKVARMFRWFFDRVIGCAIGTCLLAGCGAGEGGPTSEEASPLVFSRVTVIDATGAAPQPDMTVVIAGHRITAIGVTGTVTVPRNAQVLDGTGKFLIPGLLDMHAHLQEQELLFPLYIANGVTGVREMGGGPHEQIDRWREEIAEEKLCAPRILAAGQIVSGPKPVFPGALAVSSASEGRAAVTSLRQRGVDFAKVYSLLARDEYFAIAEEAKKQGFPFAGHLPASVSAAEASDAGQESIEHLAGSGLLLACSTMEAELRKEAVTAIVDSDYSIPVIAHYLLFGPIDQLLATYSDEKATMLFERFARNGTAQVPTLAGRRADTGHFLGPDDPRWREMEGETDFTAFIKDPYLKYIPASLRAEWYNPYTKDYTAAQFEGVRRLFQKQLEMVGEMRRAGVEFMAGSDAGNPNCYPGFSLHDELALFVAAGFTPMEALQSATLNPARFLDVADSFGTVERGKMADLVLLEANPLEAIENTRKIAAVVVGGRLISKPSLQAMLAELEASGNLY